MILFPVCCVMYPSDQCLVSCDPCSKSIAIRAGIVFSLPNQL